MTVKKKILLFVVSLSVIITIIFSISFIGKNNLSNSYADELSQADQENSLAIIEAYISGFQEESNYYSVIQKWEAAKINIPTTEYVITGSDMIDETLNSIEESQGYDGEVVHLEPNDKVNFHVDIEEEGLYELWLDYYILPQTFISPQLNIRINGQSQYNEMNQIRIEAEWEQEELPEELRYDRLGDELYPQSKLVSTWEKEGLKDPNFFFTEPLKFYFKAGKNEVSIDVEEGYILLGNVTIKNSHQSIPTYKEYIEQLGELKNNQKPPSDTVVIEAEDISLKNKQSIRGKYIRDPQITPYEYKNRVLNVLDGNSFGDAGDRVSYDFTISESGFYHLTIKYSQDANNGMPTFRRIEIDGEVPFKEMELYRFDYDSGWRNETLKDPGGNYYSVYLEEGEHTLSLSIDNANSRDIYHGLLEISDSIENIAREIKNLTGGLVDKKREWRIERYIPNIKDYLEGLNEKIEVQKRLLKEYAKKDSLPSISELEVVQKILQKFIKDPETIPHYMNRFSEGESSAASRIKSILPMLVYNPMHIDKMYFHSGGDLPDANANLFKKAIENTKAFTYSFFNPRYNETAKIDDETIEVWVNQSRLYVEIMQRMIDEDFTPKTGIKVELSLLPDENKIILSNAANNTPDAAFSVSFGRPFELALRGIIEDLSQYDGFYELSEEFNPNTFVPYIYDDGVYAMPETQDVKLLFYRKDILDFLGEEPPQTWEDVISLVPMLQRYDMNFYTPLGSDNAFKGFDTTTPFIYQFGGTLYNETGNETVINKEGAYEAFDFMTSLFTVYNLPITTSEFYQNFRSGKSPVGIGDANTYIQLKYAAPELAGQWGILPIPGIENDEGIIERWDPTYGNSAMIFSDSHKKEKAWELIKWWTSADIQSEFSYNIQSTLGNQFLYLTANIEGFAKSAWPNDSKYAILEQWEWIQTIGKVPGDYMVEREISNAWNKVVFERENPRVAVDYAVKTINRELNRKLKEFGYIDVDTNELIRPYKVPTIENVENWVKENEK